MRRASGGLVPRHALDPCRRHREPVRADVASTRWAPTAPPRLAIVGGSQGAGRLNDVALGLYDRWRTRTDVAVRHVAGPNHVDRCRSQLDALRRPDDRLDFELVDFEADMPGLYARSALLLCRSGATTVAEVAAVGVPTVLVPWSGAAEGQQDANADALAAAGAGIVIADADCTPRPSSPWWARCSATPTGAPRWPPRPGAWDDPTPPRASAP